MNRGMAPMAAFVLGVLALYAIGLAAGWWHG